MKVWTKLNWLVKGSNAGHPWRRL